AVLDHHDQLPAWLRDSSDLGQGALRVRYVVEHTHACDAVKGLIGKREVLRLSNPEFAPQASELKALLGEFDRLAGDVDSVDFPTRGSVATEHISVPASDVEDLLAFEAIELMQAARELDTLVALALAVVCGEELGAAKRRVNRCRGNRVRLPEGPNRVAIGNRTLHRPSISCSTRVTRWAYVCSESTCSRALPTRSAR